MTKDQLPEKLRNLEGIFIYDPTQKYKLHIKEENMCVLEKSLAPLLDRKKENESA